ncbi:MAG: DUF47 domain-containing protein [Lautropia sp.]
MPTSLFARLFPKDRRCFELLDRHAARIVEAAGLLCAILADHADERLRQERIAAIDVCEKQGDADAHETVLLLQRSLFTPLRRDDMRRLVNRMDDILDLIQDVGECTDLYDLRKVPHEAQQLAELSQMACRRVQDAVALLGDMGEAQTILKICQQIDLIESDSDRVMRSAMSKLFRHENDIRHLVKMKAIYEMLEAISDKCEEVADVIEGLVLRHA